MNSRRLALVLLLPGAPALGQPLHLFGALAISPDGARVAAVEADAPAHPGERSAETLVIRETDGSGTPVRVALPCAGPDCLPSAPAFAPDGRLGFLLRMPNDSADFLYETAPDGSAPRQALRFDGTLGGLRFGADGMPSVLATAGAHKRPGATQAGAAISGEIGVHEDEQRIATVADGAVHWQSPPDLYVYEYARRPGPGAPRYVGTAAPGNGDDNWWIARLEAFDGGRATVLYAPPGDEQLAEPTITPDGRAVAFIGGIMSDFGSTGGDAYRLALDAPHAKPVDLTPGLAASVTHLATGCGARDGLDASALAGADSEILALGEAGRAPRVLWSGADTIGHGGWSFGPVCAAGRAATVTAFFDRPPTLVAGPVGHWRAISHENDAAAAPPVRAESVTWRNDGFTLQGWLLSPATPAPGKSAMITEIHGGPSAASVPEFLTPESEAAPLLAAGYRVFLPNPRGSFGEGERFAAANRRDFGHGDLRDVLTGIDAAERAAPIDDQRLGLIGYSYGGYMAMWTVTQTDRFKAAVAGAGISDWLSYYGENGIDTWMLPFFGASVYADPAIYARSSPINFITHVHTPVFEFVGSADVECPMPQTEEFYHALRTLGVPTEFVVYPGQGHGLADPKDDADATRRTLAWFARWLGPSKTTG